MTSSLFPRPSWSSRIGLALTAMLAVGVGVAVASLLLVVLLIVGVAAGGWLWWQYRRLLRHHRRTAPVVMTGEYTVEVESPPRQSVDQHSRPSLPLQRDE